MRSSDPALDVELGEGGLSVNTGVSLIRETIQRDRSDSGEGYSSRAFHTRPAPAPLNIANDETNEGGKKGRRSPTARGLPILNRVKLFFFGGGATTGASGSSSGGGLISRPFQYQSGCIALLLLGWVFFQVVLFRIAINIAKSEDGTRHILSPFNSSLDGAEQFMALAKRAGSSRSDEHDNKQATIEELRAVLSSIQNARLSEQQASLQLAGAAATQLIAASTRTEAVKEEVIPLPVVVPPAPEGRINYAPDEAYQLQWVYGMSDKDWPYVGSEEYLKSLFHEEQRAVLRPDDPSFRRPVATLKDDETNMKHPRAYYNSLAVFPNADSKHMHGLLGIFSNGSRAYQPKPMPPAAELAPGGVEGALKNGGFYLNLSDALPLDREPLDSRDAVCHTIKYDFSAFEDASVVITFYNEPLSTLLRSVHSVLNLTPPPLLREIILVDDHSNLTDNLPGGPLYQYIKLLPKVKIMRLPERRGIVTARLAGAKLSTAPVLVILDSHIEVNYGWLEPQLKRLAASPNSIVFPQITAINSKDFSYLSNAGIGCYLSFKWVMQERAYFNGEYKTDDPISSPSMAGGLFAVRRDWFFELGGYDEEFSMWGAENVEMGFRTWMCGGRMECTPCSKVYHIYREKGVGYSSPSRSLLRNRLRTARVWTDDFYQLAKVFILDSQTEDIGNLDKMLALKERLQCKPFSWYLENVDTKKVPRNLDDVLTLGELRNEESSSMCIDTLQHRENGEPYGVFGCHGQGGTQGFFTVRGSKRIHLAQDETSCLGKDIKISNCEIPERDNHWSIEGKKIKWRDGKVDGGLCLALKHTNGTLGLSLDPCDRDVPNQNWKHKRFARDPQFKLPEFTPEYKAYQARLQKRFENDALQ